jgi:hypothetical protein
MIVVARYFAEAGVRPDSAAEYNCRIGGDGSEWK